MNLFVYRIAKGHEGGIVESSCPISFSEVYQASLKEMLQNTELGQIPYETNKYIDFLHRELWHCGRLRQGWGSKGLDLSGVNNDTDDTEKNRWIKNYVLGLKKYWNIDPLDPKSGYSKNHLPCHEAAGRMKMLSSVMLNTKPKDIIFIPKHSFENHHDDFHFTVCEVVGSYYFDLNEIYQDFGHVINVRHLKTFKYSENTITGKDFLGQHQKGVSEIKEHYALYSKFLNFVNNYYLC